MVLEDEDAIDGLIEAVAKYCKQNFRHESLMHVEGFLNLTMDGDDIIVIKLDESIVKPGASSKKRAAANSDGRGRKKIRLAVPSQAKEEEGAEDLDEMSLLDRQEKSTEKSPTTTTTTETPKSGIKGRKKGTPKQTTPKGGGKNKSEEKTTSRRSSDASSLNQLDATTLTQWEKPSGIKQDYCEVCLAPVTGIHYGVWTCEGCKSFFKRYLQKKTNLKCQTGNFDCLLTRAPGRVGNLCPACRLKKCQSVGMGYKEVVLGRYKKNNPGAKTPKRKKKAPSHASDSDDAEEDNDDDEIGEEMATADEIAYAKELAKSISDDEEENSQFTILNEFGEPQETLLGTIVPVEIAPVSVKK